jgi:hypothetical protein
MQYRRLNAHLHLQALPTGLNQPVRASDSPPVYTPNQEVAA